MKLAQPASGRREAPDFANQSGGRAPRSPVRETNGPVLLEKEGIIMSMYIGEALVGEGNEVAHIDLLIGSKDGPVGQAFAGALANQKNGHSNLLAVLTPNPAQAAVAKAVTDCVASGVIPKADAENLVIVCGVFIHWQAKDDNKIYQYNYEATKLSIQRAMKSEPKIDEILAKKDTAKHPFSPK
jgi:5,6,7,8-tetrahydromethanopterin hydro-lyase